jgi:hypothetical protein
MMNNFNDFIEDLIVEIATVQAGDEIEGFDITDSATAKKFDAPPTWLHTVAGEMQNRGWGRDLGAFDGPSFMIDGGGIIAASLIRANRQPKTLRQRFSEVLRSDWIALGALVVSLIALFK